MRPIPVALASVLVLLVLPAHAKTIKVPGGQPTITAAVAAAANGDTIQLAKGRYAENVALTKSLKFLGGKGVIWDGFIGGTHKNQLVANADGVVLRDITFVNGNDTVTIIGDDATIEDCRFVGSNSGVFPFGARARVRNNKFTGLQGNGFTIHVKGPDGQVIDNDLLYNRTSVIRVDAQGAGSARVERNVLDSSDGRMTLEVINAAAPKVRKNRLAFGEGDDSCILVLDCDAAEVSGNKVLTLNQGVTAGISVTGNAARVKKNVLDNLVGVSGDLNCIRVLGNDARIDKNKFRNCVAGQGADTRAILALGSGHRILGNRVADFGGAGNVSYGIHVLGSDCTVAKNRIDRLNDEYTYGIHVLGDRAVVDRNDLTNLGYEYALYVEGDDFRVTDNSVRQCAQDSLPIQLIGDGTSPGKALVRGNRVANIGNYGVDIAGSNLELRDNAVKHVAGDGFSAFGNGNLFVNNEVRDCQNDGFFIFGNGNLLKNCRVRNAARDGFDIGGGAGNTLDNCVALDCQAEGLDNGGTSTTATNCVFKKSRIDYAGNNNMASDAGTKFTTGGPGTVPEID